MKKQKTDYFREHIGLVKSIVNKMYYKIRGNRNSCGIFIEKEDMTQEGLIGLFNAVKLYDSKKHTKFSTYAYRAVHGAICRHIDIVLGYKSNIIIKPDTRKQCDKILSFIEKNNNLASVEDICKEFNYSVNKVEKLLDTINYIRMRQIDINECEDFILCSSIKNIGNIDIKNDVEKLLNKLNKRERELIEMYYGLGNTKKGHTTLEISKVYGLSKQRVDKFIKTTLNKLKRVTKKNLRSYIVK